jgi:hypothetical protein
MAARIANNGKKRVLMMFPFDSTKALHEMSLVVPKNLATMPLKKTGSFAASGLIFTPS